MTKVLATISVLLLLGACSAPRLITEPKEVVAEIREEVKADFRIELDEALAKTKVLAAELQESTKGDLAEAQEKMDRQIAELDRLMEARLEQARLSASSLITEGDRALQVRIDQVFAEVRILIQETLLQVRLMIQPLLTSAEKIGATAEASTKAITEVSASINRLVESVTTTIDNANKTITAFRTGKNEDGSDIPLTGWGGIIAGVLALVKTLYDRSRSKAEGHRWTEDELDKKIGDRIMILVAEGKLRLVEVPHVEVPKQG